PRPPRSTEAPLVGDSPGATTAGAKLMKIHAPITPSFVRFASLLVALGAIDIACSATPPSGSRSADIVAPRGKRERAEPAATDAQCLVSLPTTWAPAETGTAIALSGGNLIATDARYWDRSVARATRSKNAGRWYWEVTIEDEQPPGWPPLS